MTAPDLPLGRRIALARQRRGLSRRALGELVGRSSEWIRQVERGDRAVDRLSLLLQLASVLHISDVPAFVSCAVSRPAVLPAPPLDVTALRDAVFALPATGSGHAAPPADPLADVPAGSLVDVPAGSVTGPSTVSAADPLGERVRWLWMGWQSSTEPYTRVLVGLPAILRDLGDSTGDVAADAYRLAGQVAGRAGDGTVALAAAQRAVAASRDAGCACVRAAAIGAYAEALTGLGALASADAACDTALATAVRCGCPVRPAVRGRLHLTAARVAAAGHAGHVARRWLSGAADHAREAFPEDPRYPFGAQDVAVCAIRVALRLGLLSEAVRLSEGLEPESVPGRMRRSRGYIALACVHARARNGPGTLLALGKAEHACAEELRINRSARQTIAELLARPEDALVRADVWALAARTGLA